MAFETGDFAFRVGFDYENVFVTNDVLTLFDFEALDGAGKGAQAGVFFCPDDYFVGFCDAFLIFADAFGEDFFGDEFGGRSEAVEHFDVGAVLAGKFFVDTDALFGFALICD